eukprot:2886877-Prymnesium_polylepis.1
MPAASLVWLVSCLVALVDAWISVFARIYGAALDAPFFDLFFVGRPLDALSAMWANSARLMSGTAVALKLTLSALCTAHRLSLTRTATGRFVARGVDKCKRPTAQLTLYERHGSA